MYNLGNRQFFSWITFKWKKNVFITITHILDKKFSTLPNLVFSTVKIFENSEENSKPKINYSKCFQVSRGIPPKIAHFVSLKIKSKNKNRNNFQNDLYKICTIFNATSKLISHPKMYTWLQRIERVGSTFACMPWYENASNYLHRLRNPVVSIVYIWFDSVQF